MHFEAYLGLNELINRHFHETQIFDLLFLK